jgi:2-polyprenyl-3-methyl-5-hydroxy-6-metoxy-1,4-benzoquinol methylase
MLESTIGVEELFDPALCPCTAQIVSRVLRQWPEHLKFLRLSFGGRSLRLLKVTEMIAEMILRLARTAPHGLHGMVADYRFMCEQIFPPEELHFRRYGNYRLTSFRDAMEQVYTNAPFMARYMYGLLVSNALWINHANALDHLTAVYLPMVTTSGRHLEVGPGHGLLMCLAARSRQIACLDGWDISATSLAHTRQALAAFEINRPINLMMRDVFAEEVLAPENDGRFDSIVMSEVLEHLEQPLMALKSLYYLAKPGGLIWINVPANAAAPDHIFLLRHPDQAAALVAEAGFEIVAAATFPQAGVSVDRAIRQQLAVSCVVIGRKPI